MKNDDSLEVKGGRSVEENKSTQIFALESFPRCKKSLLVKVDPISNSGWKIKAGLLL
jgi:hypothetical protein